MSETEETEESENFQSLVQFYNVVKRHQHIDWTWIKQDRLIFQLTKIIEQTSDLNYQFPNKDFVKLRNPELVGCAVLHLAACQIDDTARFTIIKLLLNRRVDFTVKNQVGSTALHILIDRRFSGTYWQYAYAGIDNPIVNAILSAHVEFNVRENPCDKDGVSHFHIACMVNHSSAVEYFLNNGVSVDQIVKGDASIFLGYTPLHFAVRYLSFQVAEMLVKYKPDVSLKDAKGMTPIDILLEQYMESVDLIHKMVNVSPGNYQMSELMLDVEISKKIMELLLIYMESVEHPLKLDSTGLSRFHIAFTSDNTSCQEKFLKQVEDINHCVEMSSAFWPGYTALHFASHIDMKTVKFLLQHGGNIEAKNSNGLTPFDICVERYKIEDLCFILEHHTTWKNILLSDNKTKLIDILRAMQNSSTLENFLKDNKSDKGLCLPSDSPLWPGCTLLHLAVNFTETNKIISDCEKKDYYTAEDFEKLEHEYVKRIEICLKHGVDITVQNSRGRAALNLAHRLQKAKAAKLLLRVVEDAEVDEKTLSYEDSNVWYFRAAERFEKKYRSNEDSKQIKSSIPGLQSLLANVKDHHNSYLNHKSLSEFHNACVRCDVEVMKKLLKNGVNVNQPLNLLSESYPGWTPLHLVLSSYSQIDNDERIKAIDLLVNYGVDANAVDLFGNTAFHTSNRCGPQRIKLFRKISSIGTNMRLKNIFGIEPFGRLLKSRGLVIEEIEFFLNHGCHLNIYEPMINEGYLSDCLSKDNHMFLKIIRSSLILELDEFGRNAIHNIASRRPFTSNLDYQRIISILMKRGCDINRRDNFGRTPLHLAVKFLNEKFQLRLLTEGADINITNAKGSSPFAQVFEFSKRLESQEFEYQYKQILDFMSMHVRKLQIAGLYVSEQNAETLDEVLKKWPLDEAKIERIQVDLKKMKDLKIKSTLLSPYDFFSETGALTAFSYMSFLEQEAVISFFKSLRAHHFKQLGYLLRLRYKKMLKRVSLLKPATVRLNRLLGRTLPEKCSRCILRCFTNEDLESIIASVN